MMALTEVLWQARMNESEPASAHSYTPVWRLGEESACTPDCMLISSPSLMLTMLLRKIIVGVDKDEEDNFWC